MEILEILVLIVLGLVLLGAMIITIETLWELVKECVNYGWNPADIGYAVILAAFALLIILIPFLLVLQS